MLAVCATPIGNLEDVTLRVLRELREADVVLCEDTRHTRGLLDRHGIETKRLLSYHEHNEAQRVAELLPRLQAGERMALVSDAGMPGISDPGGRLISAALDAGVSVTVLPGASAVETALVVSGLLSDGYVFLGFVPRKAAELREWAQRVHALELPAVAFESPQRLSATLDVLNDELGERQIAVCRELTKLHEEIVRGTSAEVRAHFAEHPPRGEVVLVLAGGEPGPPDERAALEAVSELVAAGLARRRAAQVVASLSGVPANRLYRGTL